MPCRYWFGVLLTRGSGDDDEFLLEIYAGSVAVGWDVSDSTVAQEFWVLLPVQGTTIRTYNLNKKTFESDVAVMVAPGGFTGLDQPQTTSVDAFRVELEPQRIETVDGTPSCLVLYFTVSLRNAALHRISYNVSFTWLFGSAVMNEEKVDSDTRPADREKPADREE